MRRLPKCSAHTGSLPKGCRLCGTGGKLVLFVTGLCGKGCFYCPLSTEKRGKDAVFANEKRVASDRDIIDEAKLIDAAGTGITGGDPLAVPARTIRYIRMLKRRFGKGHHIHLYTATADEKMVDRLANAGLDEIRFHPPLAVWMKMNGTKYDGAIRAAKQSGLAVGAEVPAVPGMKRELAVLIRYLDSAGANFVNLNELEFSETNCNALLQRGFRVKDDVSSGVAGSEKLALDIIAGLNLRIPLHYCSASYKDGVQLRRRITRRAKNIARPGDIVSREGLLVKGVVECGGKE